jgi:HAE1 family hydrophobic/amphiphilic exporter-1
VETSITKPLEEIINTIQGIDELSSVSVEGVSSIIVQFLLERNRDIAAQDVRDKVNTILARLPAGTDPPIIDKFDIDAAPVMSISVSAPVTSRRSLSLPTSRSSRTLKLFRMSAR